MAIANQTGSGWDVPDPPHRDILPGGGAPDEVLAKRSAVDADVAWKPPSGGGGGAGLTADSVVTAYIANEAVTFAKMQNLLAKQYLGRTAGTTGDVESVPAATLAADLQPSLIDNDLTASTTVAPSKSAVNAGLLAKQDLAPVQVAYSTAIPLDTAGNGKAMTQHTLILDSVFTVSNPVEGGNCSFSLIGDGSHTPDLSAFAIQGGFTYNNAADANNIMSAVRAFNSNLLYGALGTAADTTVPTLSSATVADTDPLRINLVWSEAMNSTVSAAAAFAISAGHTVTAHTYDGPTTSHLTVTTPFVTGEAARTLAYTQPGSAKMQDLAGNLLVNIGAAAITNNVSSPTNTARDVTPEYPDRINLTWSEAMNSTIPSHTAFAVSAGHPLTAHVYVDATHSYLTTSTPFVNGEAARTLAYTPPGTNDMKDTAGGNLVQVFSGLAITNTIGAGKITYTETFAGTDDDPPPGRYTPDQAGFTIQSNHLSYAGAAYGTIVANNTAGDNTLAINLLIAEAQTYFYCALRYVDDNNYVAALMDASDILRLDSKVAGVATTIATDSIARIDGGGSSVLTFSCVGNDFTVAVTGTAGGAADGSFGGTATAHASATKHSFGWNYNKLDTFVDSVVLS